MGSCCQPCEDYFSRPHFRKLLAAVLMEFVGTFFYALVFAMALAAGMTQRVDNVYAPLVIGLFVGALTFAGMNIAHGSTGHFNPVITIAVAMENASFGWERLIYFIIFQLLGGLFGGMAGAWVFGNTNFLPVVATQTTGLLVEFLFSFIVALTAIRIIQKNDRYGFAVGAAIFAGMSVSRTVSGGVFNPAVAFGLFAGAAVEYDVPANIVSNLFVYIFGPILGAAAAVLFVGIVSTLQGPVGDDVYTSGGEESDYKPEYKPSYKEKKPAYEEKPAYKETPGAYEQPQPAYKQPAYEQPAYEQPKPEPAYGNEPVQTYTQQPAGYTTTVVEQPAVTQGYTSGEEVVTQYEVRNPSQGYAQPTNQGYVAQTAAGGYGYAQNVQAAGVEMGQMGQFPMYDGRRQNL